VESVATGRPLARTLAKHILCPFTNPRKFFTTRAVFVVWTLYAATYLTANLSETLVEQFLDTEKAPVGTIISSAVFAINTPLSVWKDMSFAQIFGKRADTSPSKMASAAVPSTVAVRKLPVSVGAAFLVRDIITVFGSFAIAPQVSAAIPDDLAQSMQGKSSVAQLIVPAMTQVVATPAHLLGLDLYNRPKAIGVLNRAYLVRQKLLVTTIMRAFRLIPAYGFGIIFNSRLRSTLRSKHHGA
jgi:hypothetical protein